MVVSGPQAPGAPQPAVSVSFPQILAIGFLVCVALSWSGIKTIWLEGTYNDTDDAMRMLQVRDWLAGQGWYDLRAMRLDPPGGVLMHWSRVVDLPVGGLIRLFGLFADSETADRLTRIAFPLSMQALLLLATGLSGRLLAGRPGEGLAIFLVICSGMSFGQFVPGRIDHHAPQIVLLSLLTWACLCALDPQRPRMAALAGLFAALSLSIAVENMAFIMVLMVIYPVAYAAQGAAMRAALVWMGGGFAISLGLFYALFQSPMLWQSNFCDALSAVHMRAAITGGTAMVLLAAYDRWRKPGLGQRMIVIGLAGLLAALPLFFDRHCFLDPFSGIDPVVRELWLAIVQEAYSIPKILAKQPDGVWGWVLPWTVGTAAIALAAFLERGLARSRYIALLALTLAGCATAFYMVRSISSVSPLALLGGVWAVTRVSQWSGKEGLGGAIIMPLTLAPFTAIFWISSAPPSNASVEKQQSENSKDCIAEKSHAPLRTLPQGLVLALPDLGPFVLLFTDHSVMAAPYHRNNHGNRLMFEILIAPPDTARAMLNSAGVRYIAICDAYNKGAVITAKSPAGLSSALAKEMTPDWLRPIKLETPVKVYEVAAAP